MTAPPAIHEAHAPDSAARVANARARFVEWQSLGQVYGDHRLTCRDCGLTPCALGLSYQRSEQAAYDAWDAVKLGGQP